MFTACMIARNSSPFSASGLEVDGMLATAVKECAEENSTMNIKLRLQLRKRLFGGSLPGRSVEPDRMGLF